MDKKITAVDITFAEFPRKASSTYLIPSLQRPYTWKKEEVRELWEDVLGNGIGYYIGSIVVVGSGQTTKRDQIIDGQQRLTTLALMLIAIRNYIKGKKSLNEISEEIEWMISEPMHGGNSRLRLSFSNSNSEKIYSEIVAGKISGKIDSKTQKNFVTNLHELERLLKEYSSNRDLKKISILFEKIKNLQLIFINCLDKSSAYKLFESINATGVKLASTDLIKNSIFEALQKDATQLEFAEKAWLEMQQDIFSDDSTALRTYIRHHWISRGNYTSHAELFSDFDKKYLTKSNSTSEVLNYLKSLTTSAKIYSSLKSAAIDDLDKLPNVRFEKQEIKNALEFLSYLGVEQVYSVLLYLYEKDIGSFGKNLNRLVAFQFIYKYIPGSPSEPEKKFFAALPSGKKTKQEIFNGLFKLCNDKKSDFIDRLTERVKYREGQSGDIQFILEKFLYFEGGANSFEKPTIEHIISQKSSPDVLQKISSDRKKVKLAINSIGNLTILEREDNGSKKFSDKPFKEKMVHFKKDLFKANRQLDRYPFIDEPSAAIDIRGKDLADTVYDIFLKVLKTGKWPKK